MSVETLVRANIKTTHTIEKWIAAEQWSGKSYSKCNTVQYKHTQIWTVKWCMANRNKIANFVLCVAHKQELYFLVKTVMRCNRKSCWTLLAARYCFIYSILRHCVLYISLFPFFFMFVHSIWSSVWMFMYFIRIPCVLRANTHTHTHCGNCKQGKPLYARGKNGVVAVDAHVKNRSH